MSAEKDVNNAAIDRTLPGTAVPESAISNTAISSGAVSNSATEGGTSATDAESNTNTAGAAVSRDEIVAAIARCAEELDRRPTLDDFTKMTGISERRVLKHFDTWREALLESGVSREAIGILVQTKEVFLSWAGVVRQIKRIPSLHEYRRRGKYGPRMFRSRFGSWSKTPAGMREFALREGLEREWADVMAIIADHLRLTGEACTSKGGPAMARLANGPMYGPLMAQTALVHEPTNEAGVAVLFGMMAKELGFRIIRVQTEFPDCEAYYEAKPGKWQRVRVEFEFESRNFCDHGHDVGGCDVIVCWRDNWPECPLKIVELKQALSNQEKAYR